MSTEVAKRIVPGAPPPTSVSTKSQKKKRRTAKKEDDAPEVLIPDTNAAALTEKAPAEEDVKSGAVAEELVVSKEEPVKEKQPYDPASVKTTPVVDHLNKRLKQLHKKITRIHAYSDKPASQLNDDQKKTLATLPLLEGTAKELEEQKKEIEALEAEQAKEADRQRAEAEEAEKQRVAEAVVAAQKAHTTRTAQILDFIRLHSLLTAGEPSALALNIAEEEVNAIFVAGSALLAHEAETKQDAVNGFLLGEGEATGVSYLRLLEITDSYVNPPPVQEEVPAEAEEETQESEVVTEPEAVPEIAVEVQQTTIGGLPPATNSMNFSFMQESELEQDPVAFENGAEWVEREDITHVPEHSVPAEVAEIHKEIPSDEIVQDQEQPASGNIAIDWADDEGGLPSIDGLHATFGTSGTATPSVDQPIPAVVPETQPENPWKAPPVAVAEAAAPHANGVLNGQHTGPAVDEDGFVTATKGSRGRGRARGNFRGGNEQRGGYRGGDRGGFRGNYRGGRGRPFNGGENGNYRGNSDGEHRGRGRGRGRGYDRGTGVRGGGPRPTPNEA